MKVIAVSAFEELKKLHEQGFMSEVTKATDGSDVVLAKSSTGLTRIFEVFDMEEK